MTEVRTLSEQARLVAGRLVGDLFEQGMEHLAHPRIAAKTRLRQALALQRGDHVLTPDRQIAHGQRRFFRQHLGHPGLEPLVRIIAFGESRAGDVGPAQREQPVQMLGSDPAHEAADRLVLRLGVGTVHVLAHQMGDRFDRLARQPQLRQHRAHHLGAQVLVLVERVAFAVGARRGRARFPHVVQQCGKAQRDVFCRRGVERREVVAIHVVSVPIVLVDLDAFEQLRPELAQHARLAQDFETDRRLRSAQ